MLKDKDESECVDVGGDDVGVDDVDVGGGPSLVVVMLVVVMMLVLVVVVVSRVLVGDRLTLMSARLGWRPAVPGMSSSHTSPPIHRILTLPLRNLHYSPNPLPNERQIAPTRFCFRSNHSQWLVRQPTFVLLVGNLGLF